MKIADAENDDTGKYYDNGRRAIKEEECAKMTVSLQLSWKMTSTFVKMAERRMHMTKLHEKKKSVHRCAAAPAI